MQKITKKKKWQTPRIYLFDGAFVLSGNVCFGGNESVVVDALPNGSCFKTTGGAYTYISSGAKITLDSCPRGANIAMACS